MLYLTCTTITSVDLAYHGVNRAKDWVSVNCGTRLFIASAFFGQWLAISDGPFCYIFSCIRDIVPSDSISCLNKLEVNVGIIPIYFLKGYVRWNPVYGWKNIDAF